jgi:methyl-accepting chemotaxis protein
MKWFYNLKIQKKLVLSFSIVILIGAIIGYIGIVNINTLADQSDQSYKTGTLSVVYVAKMEDAFQKMRAEIRNILIVETKADVNKAFTAIDNFNQDFETNSKLYESTYSNDEEKKMHESVNVTYSNFIKALGGFRQFMSEDKKAEARDYMYNVLVPANAELYKTLPVLVDYNEKNVSEFNAQTVKTASSAKMQMIIIIIIGVILSVILGLFIASIIDKPIQKLEHAALKIAEGNLNIKIDIETKDEIGSLANSFRIMLKNFQDLIQKVLNQSVNINKESEELFSISNISASASAELQAQSSTASSSSEQVSANVSTVATSTEEMTASIKEISKNTASASSLTKESEERANEASKVMSKLGQSSHEIGNIVKSITTIAEQTNLLALNATIEAARAGELGKGFAVVANEVKELAKESAKATEDITNKIKAIQDDTLNAVDVIKGIIENISKVNEVTNSIASAIEEQSVTTNEVNRNLNEATQGVQSIVEVISGISAAANDYSKQAVVLKNSSSALKSMSNDLEKEIKANFRF